MRGYGRSGGSCDLLSNYVLLNIVNTSQLQLESQVLVVICFQIMFF